jgi:transcriptional regulator with XRE-family HTH domain
MKETQIHKKIQERIFKYRQERGLTLRQLAEKAGCTPSYISQVENGLTVCSLSMVGKLATALNIPVIDLFSEELEEDQIAVHMSKRNRKTIKYPDGKVSSQMLATRVSIKRMEPLVSVIKPGGTSDEAERMAHPGGTEEFVLVLKNEIDFSINGKEFHLCEGDTLYFDGTLPHSWVNNGKTTAEVLFVFSPPIW